MAIQTTYSENIRTGVAGHIPDMTQADISSRTDKAARRAWVQHRRCSRYA